MIHTLQVTERDVVADSLAEGGSVGRVAFDVKVPSMGFTIARGQRPRVALLVAFTHRLPVPP